jgi:sugar phosphate isomerase/epimerase
VIHLGSVLMKSLTMKLEQMALAGEMYSRGYTKTKLKLVAGRVKASPHYVELAKAALDRLLPACERNQVKLAIETRSHYEQVPNEQEMTLLMQHYANCPWIGCWHDFGHVQRKANLGFLDHAEVLRELEPRLLGCHIHDVEWPAKDHRVPGLAGGVDFEELLPLVPREIPWVWELSPTQRRAQVQEQAAAWRAKGWE